MSTLNGLKNWKFKNWAETYSCFPSLYFEPNSLDELKDILKKANEETKKIRIVGCGHSPSAICCTDDFMISLKKFDNIIDIDKTNLKVKLEAGVIMTRLNKILNDNGMALSVLGSISDQTIGGAISTAFHGTGSNFRVLSDYVTEMEVMLASGEIKSYNKQSEEFPALLCSLGCLGIILKLTIQCEPRFNLEQIEYGSKLEDVLTSLEDHTNVSDHFRLFWYPHTDYVINYHASRTNKEVTHRAKNWLFDMFIGYYLLEFLYWIATFCNSIIPFINRFYYKLASQRKVTCDLSYKIFNFDCLFKQYAFECAIPKKETAYFILKLKSWLENNPQVKIHFGVEIRFVKEDNIWLSPCYQQDSCYINILMFKPYGKDYSREEWWKINESIMIECKGRPAWSKTHNLVRKDLVKIYPKFNDFDTLRRSLDPNNIFINEFLEKFFH